MKTDLKKLYDSRNIDVNRYMQNLIIDGKYGYITLSVKDINDVVSSYSIKNYESLSDSFRSAFDFYAEQIPDNIPLFLELTDHEFSPEEKQAIQRAVSHEYGFDYVIRYKEIRKKIRIACINFVLSILFLFYLYYTWKHSEMVIQLVWIPLWFFLDSVFQLVLSVLPEHKKMKRKSMQKQTVKLIFTKEYNDYISKDQLESYKKEVISNLLNNR